MRDSIVIYRSFYEASKIMNPEEFKEFWVNLLAYSLDEDTPKFESPMGEAMFIMAKPQIDANIQRQSNGSKGGRPTQKPMVIESNETTKPMVTDHYENEKPMVIENSKTEKPMVIDHYEIEKPMVTDHYGNPKPNVNVNVNDNVNVYIKEKEKKEKSAKPTPSFARPTVEEVRAYCQERKNNIDPETFIAFYDSKGWKVGREPMRNWKSAVITWEKRDKENKRGQPTAGYKDMATRDYGDMNDLEKEILAN